MNKQAQTKPPKKNATAKFWIKLTVLLVIVFSTVSLVTTSLVIAKLKKENRDLQNQAIALEEENKNLQQYLDHKDTDEGAKDVAEGELGMVDPDTVIYDFD